MRKSITHQPQIQTNDSNSSADILSEVSDGAWVVAEMNGLDQHRLVASIIDGGFATPAGMATDGRVGGFGGAEEQPKCSGTPRLTRTNSS